MAWCSVQRTRTTLTLPLYLYDSTYLLLLPLQTYGSMEYMYVCMYVCMYVHRYMLAIVKRHTKELQEAVMNNNNHCLFPSKKYGGTQVYQSGCV